MENTWSYFVKGRDATRQIIVKHFTSADLCTYVRKLHNFPLNAQMVDPDLSFSNYLYGTRVP